MKKLDLRLLRLIKDSKGQFFSISLVLILAIAVFLSMNMSGDNLDLSLKSFYQESNFADLFISLNSIPQNILLELGEIDGIRKVQGRISKDSPFKSSDPNEKIRIRLLSLPQDDDYTLNDNILIEGSKLLEDPQDALLLEQFAKARNISLGDRITILHLGNEYNFNVKGIVANPEFVYLMEDEVNILTHPDKFGIAYIREDQAQKIFSYPAAWNEILIKLDKEEKKNEIINKLEDSLKRYGLIHLTEKENQLSYSIMEMEINQVKRMSWAMTIFFLFSASLIIYIMLSRMVDSDRTSIGVLKALGYDNQALILHYIKYSLSLAIFSSVIGILLSIPLLGILTDLFLVYMNVPSLESSLSPYYFFLALILCLFTCLSAGYLGSRRAMTIMPAHAMLAESPKLGVRSFLEKFPFIWKKLSFSWKMIIRNISRNKKRALVLLTGVCISTALTMVPLYMSLIWDEIFEHHYMDFQKMDYHLTFNRPYSEELLFDLQKMADIEYIEGKAEFPFEVSRGWKKKTLSLIALKKDSSFYNFVDLEGRKINLQENEVILSEISAKILDAKVGDLLDLKNFLPGKDDFQLRVSGINKQNIGLNIYMDLESLNSFLNEKKLITGALIKSTDKDLAEKLSKANGVGAIESTDEMIDSYREYLDMVMASVLILLVFAGILAFAIVYNVTIINIRERSLEISVFRVLGFEKKQIYSLISKENFLVSSLAILIGLPLGRQMCRGIVASVSQELMSIPLILKPSTYLLTVLITLIFILLAQIISIKKIDGIHFLDALKSRVT